MHVWQTSFALIERVLSFLLYVESSSASFAVFTTQVVFWIPNFGTLPGRSEIVAINSAKIARVTQGNSGHGANFFFKKLLKGDIVVWAWSKSTIWKLGQFFFHRKISELFYICLFGKKCDQSWCRKADFFFNFFLSWNFWNISKTKSSSKIFLLYKSLFQVLGYLLKFEFLLYLKKYSLEPHAEKWGQNRSTGISRWPEFPG